MIAILKILTASLLVLGTATALDVQLERPHIEYWNPKYLKYINMTVARRSRHGPIYCSLELETKETGGNNITFDFHFWEEVSGRYLLIMQTTIKLCDFLYHEPYVGQMFAKQFQGNWTCPFSAGKYAFKDIIFNMDNFPYNIPFTFASFTVTTRTNVEVFYTPKNESKDPILRFKVFAKVTQKPKKANSGK